MLRKRLLKRRESLMRSPLKLKKLPDKFKWPLRRLLQTPKLKPQNKKLSIPPNLWSIKLRMKLRLL